MATIERFVGPLGVGSDADVWSLMDYRYTSDMPLYSSTGGYDNGKSIRSGWAGAQYGFNCSAGKTKVLGFWVRGCPTQAYNSDIRYGLLHFIGPDILLYNTPSGLDVRCGTTQIATSTDYITSSLTHVEMKVFSNASTGTVEVKLNGASVLSGTNLNTDGADITRIDILPLYSSTVYSSGIFVADDWVGLLIPKLLIPNGDDFVQFTPSAGTDNYAMVDETEQDGDTTYVETSTVTHKDIYTFSDLAAGYTPKVVSLVTTARSNEGTASIKRIAVQDAVEYDLGTSTLGVAYPAQQTEGIIDTLNTCPDGTSWTQTKLNAIKWGYTRTA